MIIAKRAVLWIFPPEAIKMGSNMLMCDGLVKVEKEDFPIIPIGSSYVLDIQPYSFGNGGTTYTSATVDLKNIEYHEAEGGFFQLTCTANPRGYAGLCLAYGEIKE